MFDDITAGETFTVEEAVEKIGFGRFHILLFVIMGSTNVRNQLVSTSCLHWSAVCVCNSVCVCVCVCARADRGGDGDHAVSCSFSWDSMWVASGRLAGRSRLHSESQFIDQIDSDVHCDVSSVSQHVGHDR